MTASKQPTILIHEGPRSLIYYQTNSQYGQPVVIKVLNADHPTDNQLIRFNNEYELTRDLKINGVRRAIALTRWEDRPALVMAYVPGLNLGQAFVAQKKSLVDFLQVAINIAHTLGHLHQQHIIHRDISSHNILVNPETKRLLSLTSVWPPHLTCESSTWAILKDWPAHWPISHPSRPAG